MSQETIHSHSLSDPETFWSHHAARLHWHTKPSRTLSQSKTTRQWSWFPDGEISTTYNCVDRHVSAGNGNNVAIIWESPVTSTTEKYTYAQLLDEVEILAGVLREEGVQRGDVVIIYSTTPPILGETGNPKKLTGTVPMIPAALIACLAITRLGAIHAAVFGGFAPAALAQRIDAARPRAIMTASCGIEGSKGAISYRPLVEAAVKAATFKPSKTIIWQRDQLRWNQPDKRDGQRNWQRLVKSARMRGVRAGPVPIKSGEGLYIIYTSGELALVSLG